MGIFDFLKKKKEPVVSLSLNEKKMNEPKTKVEVQAKHTDSMMQPSQPVLLPKTPIQIENGSDFNELNFITPFTLSHNGIISAIALEMKTLRICIYHADKCTGDAIKILDRIMSISIRKLLLEDSSILLTEYPDFKMPSIPKNDVDAGQFCLHIIAEPFSQIDCNLSVKDWRKQVIAYIAKDEGSIPTFVPSETYENIQNKLNRREFKQSGYVDLWRTSYQQTDAVFKEETIQVYERTDQCEETNKKIHRLLDEVGYYKLTIYEFVKQYADKNAAHMAYSHMPLIEVFNTPSGQPSLMYQLSQQLIMALKQQIPEFSGSLPTTDCQTDYSEERANV